MSEDLTDRMKEIGSGNSSSLDSFKENTSCLQVGDIVSIKLNEGFGIINGELYWGMHRIGRVNKTIGSEQDSEFVYGFVRAISKRDIEVNFVVKGHGNINDRSNTNTIVLGAYVPKEAIAKCTILHPYKK